MAIIAGTDTYGRVKTVGGIPIVTKFAMLHFLPLFPRRSFYYFGEGQTKFSGVPFVASMTSTAIKGIPLTRVDRMSVVMAYVRGVFGTLAVIGCFSIFPLVSYLAGGPPLDDVAVMFTYVLIACLVIGMVGGLLTYAVPLTSKRELSIRKRCGELLGVCVDPARVPPEIAIELEKYGQRRASRSNDEQISPRIDCIRKLIAVRSRVVRKHQEADRWERKTDELLDELDRLKDGEASD